MNTSSDDAIGFVPLGQADLFTTTAPSTSIIGLVVTLPRTCMCGATDAVVGSSAGPHHARLLCARCDRHRGWMSAETHSFISHTIDVFGRTHEPIVVSFKNSRMSADNPQ